VYKHKFEINISILETMLALALNYAYTVSSTRCNKFRVNHIQSHQSERFPSLDEGGSLITVSLPAVVTPGAPVRRSPAAVPSGPRPGPPPATPVGRPATSIAAQAVSITSTKMSQ